MHFTELEYKYRADNVTLESFLTLMETLSVQKSLDISSWDVYYVQDGSTDKFQRFRNGDTPELTKKVKVRESNNWNRVEVDLPLDPNRITEKIVSKFVGIDNYTINFKIYKTCSIHWLDNVNFVYYIVYDTNMDPLGRFIEVELNKDKVATLENPLEELNKYEKLLETLGITHKNRLKKSLFEMFVKIGEQNNGQV